MAITIAQQPPELAYSEDYLFFRATSTNSSTAGFKYVCTLTISGTTVNTVVPPNIVGDAVFDASYFIKHAVGKSVVDDVEGHMLFDSDNVFFHPSAYCGTLVVTFQEYYDGGLQGTAVTTTHYLVPGRGFMREGLHPSRQVQAAGTYVAGTAPLIMDVDNAYNDTQEYNVYGAGIFSICLLNLAVLNPDSLRITAGGTSVDIPLDGSSAVQGASNFPDIDSPTNTFVTHLVLTSSRWNTFTTGTALSNTATFTLQPIVSGIVGSTTTFNLLNPCQGAVVSFLDECGGFANVPFEGAVEETTESEGKVFRKAYDGFNASALTSLNGFQGQERYSSLTQKTYTVYSAHDSTLTAKTISRLASSKMHFLYLVETNEWVPVVLKNFENNRHIGLQRKVAAISITFTYSQPLR